MKSTIFDFCLVLLLCFSPAFEATGQSMESADNILKGYLLLDNSDILRHLLVDLPGSVIIFMPQGDTTVPQIMPRKVLRNGNNLPELKTEPALIFSSTATKQTAQGIRFLAFLSSSMTEKNEVKFSVMETSHAEIYDRDVNWDAFDARVSEIMEKNPDLPLNTKFAVIRAAAVITVNHQMFTRVDKAGQISGWGFMGEKKYLSQEGSEAVKNFITIAVSYSDHLMTSLLGKSWPERISSDFHFFEKDTSQIRRDSLQTILSDSIFTTAVARGQVINYDAENIGPR